MYRMGWTDERMDDFAKHTDRRFDAVDQRFDAVDRRVESLERRMEDGFNKLDQRIERIEARIDDLHRTMLQLGAGALVTLVVGFAGVILTQL